MACYLRSILWSWHYHATAISYSVVNIFAFAIIYTTVKPMSITITKKTNTCIKMTKRNVFPLNSNIVLISIVPNVLLYHFHFLLLFQVKSDDPTDLLDVLTKLLDPENNSLQVQALRRRLFRLLRDDLNREELRNEQEYKRWVVQHQVMKIGKVLHETRLRINYYGNRHKYGLLTNFVRCLEG